jgi:hypothetical protein
VLLPNCNNEGVAYAFLDKMLNRFGVSVEVFIDQTIEFHEDFQKLCEKALIDPWTTSQDHPKANVLVE